MKGEKEKISTWKMHSRDLKQQGSRDGALGASASPGGDGMSISGCPHVDSKGDKLHFGAQLKTERASCSSPQY